jgi:hypothetical protein
VKRLALSLHDQTIELRDAAGLADDLEILFGAAKADVAKSRHVVTITREQDDRFALDLGGASFQTGLSREDLFDLLQDEVVRALIVDMTSAVVLHAGAVSLNGRAIVLAGPTGSGKTSLAAWFVANGFHSLSDEVVALVGGATDVVGFPRAMVVKGEAAGKVEALTACAEANTIRTAASTMIRPMPARIAGRSPQPCSLIIFPKFEPGAPLRIAAVSATQAGLRLMGCNLNARNLHGEGFGEIGALARAAPAFVLHYGDFDQLGGVVDVLVRLLLEGQRGAPEARRFLSAFPDPAAAARSQRPAAPVGEIPAPTPRRPARKLTIHL